LQYNRYRELTTPTQGHADDPASTEGKSMLYAEVKTAENLASPMKRASHILTDELERFVAQLENDPSLVEANQLRQRVETLDRLDAYFPEMPQGESGAESIEPALYRRARALRAKLEAANCELYEAIRNEIQRGERPDALLWYATHSLDSEAVHGPANGLGYDYLDELISGAFPFEEPDAAHIVRESEKVFYQPTPARHIFRLIGLTALTANDVLVDLGSGLGHVPMLVSICTDASSIGIELESAYVECSRKCAQRLNLDRVTFLQGDARVTDLTTGTVFYLYTPFTGSILNAVLNRLKREAATRRIRICSYGPCTPIIAQEPWLAAASTPEAHRIALFSSRD
jgi:Histone methylation protein DOT1